MFILVCFTCLCGGAARNEKFTSVNTDVITRRRLSTNHRATAVFACVAINMPIMSFLSSWTPSHAARPSSAQHAACAAQRSLNNRWQCHSFPVFSQNHFHGQQTCIARRTVSPREITRDAALPRQHFGTVLLYVIFVCIVFQSMSSYEFSPVRRQSTVEHCLDDQPTLDSLN